MTTGSELDRHPLRELWDVAKFNLCFAVPMRFSSEYFVKREMGPGSHGFYRTTRTWWQWRSRIFWDREREIA